MVNMQNFSGFLDRKKNQFGVSLLAWLTCRIFLGFIPGRLGHKFFRPNSDLGVLGLYGKFMESRI